MGSIIMSKRTPEEIIQSVKRYQRGETSQGAEAKRLGVSKQAFQDWVRIYETYGESVFLRTENRRYSKELKLSAVQAYLNGEGSHAAICKKYGISSRTQLQNWIKMYNGHKELRPSRGRGSDIYMTKGRTTTYEERIEIVSYCIEHGNDYPATIERYGVSYQQIYSWECSAKKTRGTRKGVALSGVRQEYLYICVQEMHEEGYAITETCDILNLNRSSYYKWTHRSKGSSALENEALLHDIGLIYAEHNGTYGYRRIADEYNATHDKQYNLKRFYRLVHIVGLLAVIRRKRPAYQRSKPEVTAENILNREFTAKTVNEKWCTDVTEMKYGSEGGKAYLSAILDLKGRDIVSFAIGRHNNNQLVFETFDLAIQKYPDAHPLFHSDRGFQYTSKQFKDMLEKQGMRQSMSRVGRSIDNGPMEGFWGILKCEMYYLNHFETYEELVDAVGQFIHYYNYQRRQHRLNCLAPMNYRSLLDAA